MPGKKAPTKAESRRMQMIKDSGCVCCLLATRGTTPPDVHHITAGGRRLGHMHTIGCCAWHHRGVSFEGENKQSMSGIFGPSLAFGKRTFNEFFGSEEILLLVQNLVLEHFDRSPWPSYNPPYLVRREATELWTKEKQNWAT